MTILVSIFAIAACSFVLWKFPFFRNSGLKLWQVLCAFYLKLIIAGAFFSIYTHYPNYKNQSDSQAFYRSAGQFATIAHENFGDYLRASFHISVKSPEIQEKIHQIPYWNRPYEMAMPNDTRQTVILYSFVYLLAFGSLPIMLIITNFLAFCGLFALFRAFLLSKMQLLPAIIACFAIPSTLFWSSGLLKEVWLLLFMGFTLYSATMFFATKKLHFAIFTLLWAIALLHIKLYVALCFLPLLAIYAIRRKLSTINIFVFYGSAFAILTLCILCANWFFNFNSIEALINQRNTFIRMLEFHNHNNIILQTFGNSSHFIAQIFVALGNIFLRPNIFDTQNIFVFFAGLENTVIALLLLYCIIIYIKKHCVSTTLNKQIPNDYAIITIAFVGVLFVIIGFTTPNMGALMRYKSVLLPFMLVLVLNIVCKNITKNKNSYLCVAVNN